MKYCIKCGNKLDDNNKFCSKCGYKTDLAIKEEKQKVLDKKENNKEKLLLIVGTILIIIASCIFAFATWNEMSAIFRLLFLAIESLLFLSISLFSQKVNEKLPYKSLWFLGITFIPIMLHLVAYEQLLGYDLSYKGSSIFVYLSISSFVCALIYFLSYKLFKSKIFIYISYIFVYLLVIFVPSIFKLYEFNGLDLVFLIIILFNLLVCIFYSFIKNENYNKTIHIFMSIVVFLSSLLTCAYCYEENILLASITFVLDLITLFIMLFKSNKNIVIYLYPFIIYILIDFSIDALLHLNLNTSIFLLILLTILVNFIMNVKNNLGIKTTSYILMLFNIIFILMLNDVGYKTLFACALVILLALLFIIRLNDEKTQVLISKLIIPTNIFLIAYSLINAYVNMDIAIIYLIVSIICFTVYIIINQNKKNDVIKGIFEIFSYIFIVISSYLIITNDVGVFAFILSETVWLYYFIYNSVIKKNKIITIFLLIMLIVNFILSSMSYSIDLYYSLLFVCILTSVLDFIRVKINNKKSIYIYIALISSSLAALYDLSIIPVFGLCINILSYVFTYYLFVKEHKCVFIIKYLYTLMGFALIYSIFHYFIDVFVVGNILVLVTYIIIIISMYLLKVDTDNKVLSYSLIVSIPYIELVNEIDIFNNYIISLEVLLVIILILIYFEKVFKLNESAKNIIELVLLIIIHLFTITDMMIFDFIFSAFYIFFGYYKKRDSFVVFGTLLLIANLFINIFDIANNISVTYVLLVIGVLMLGYVFYVEAKKKRK